MSLLLAHTGLLARQQAPVGGTPFEVIDRVDYISNATTTNNRDVTLPSGILSGDLILMFHTSRGSDTTISADGWVKLTEVNHSETLMSIAVFYKIADGTEGGTVNVSWAFSGRNIASTYLIRGSNYVVTGASNEGLDPPQASGVQGTVDCLFFSALGIEPSDNNVSGVPTNYTDLIQVANSISSASGRFRMGTCRRFLDASSDNPSAFSTTGTATYTASLTVMISNQ